MRVFLSYHRKDTKYREKIEKLFIECDIDYYAVPLDANFDGKSNECIKNFIINKMKKCDVVLVLVGDETYRRPHVDREIHTALKGGVGKRKGIVSLLLQYRGDSFKNLNIDTYPIKLRDNKNYVVNCMYADVKTKLIDCLKKAIEISEDSKINTNHTNPCMPLSQGLYYDMDSNK